jgi:hypothetical protein
LAKLANVQRDLNLLHFAGNTAFASVASRSIWLETNFELARRKFIVGARSTAQMV